MTQSSGPRHIGFIMDGNRRFAKRLMQDPTKGHEYGANKIWKVYGWCRDAGVKETTFYAFSTENFNRPKKEFDYLMSIFERESAALLKDDRVKEEGIRIRFIGRLHLFNEGLQKLMTEINETTRQNTKFTMNFAIGYGGRGEIVDATRRIAEAVKQGTLDLTEIDEKTVLDHLYLSDEPDLIIRTGGEKRTSNFLPYQSVYSEWIFLDKLWPEFDQEDFDGCLSEFKGRERRIGK